MDSSNRLKGFSKISFYPSIVLSLWDRNLDCVVFIDDFFFVFFFRFLYLFCTIPTLSVGVESTSETVRHRRQIQIVNGVIVA